MRRLFQSKRQESFIFYVVLARPIPKCDDKRWSNESGVKGCRQTVEENNLCTGLMYLDSGSNDAVATRRTDAGILPRLGIYNSRHVIAKGGFDLSRRS
jgi:hypothetical protein